MFVHKHRQTGTAGSVLECLPDLHKCVRTYMQIACFGTSKGNDVSCIAAANVHSCNIAYATQHAGRLSCMHRRQDLRMHASPHSLSLHAAATQGHVLAMRVAESKVNRP